MITELLLKIGPITWVFVVMVLYVLAVVAERTLYFHRTYVRAADFLRGVSQMIRTGKYNEARHAAAKLPGPIGRVADAVLRRHDLPYDQLRGIATSATQVEVFKIERNIRGLLVVSTVGPLVGMLGTILALIEYFSQPGILEGIVPAFKLGEAIFQALWSTAVGLIISIPTYLFYSFLAMRARAQVNAVERAALEIIYFICDVREQDKSRGEELAEE